MAHLSFFARMTGSRHLTSLQAVRHRANVMMFLGILVILLGVVVAPAQTDARCIPVAERQERPPTEFVLHRAKEQGIHDNNRAASGALQIPLPVWRVSEKSITARGPALPQDSVELTFLGHSSFLIRTFANATAVTDYNGYIRAPFAPDIVTMNRAYSSHYTDVIEAGVKHTLRGWMEKGVIPSYNVTVRDLHVTNVPTNIRQSGIGDSGFAGNSIFIFKSAGLCIVHLGHLQHRLIPSHAARVGMVDVLLAPIDDSYTMPHALLVKVIDDLRPVLVIPMHYGFGGTLESFIALMRQRKFAIRISRSRSVRFTKATLPARQTVLVLQSGAF